MLLASADPPEAQLAMDATWHLPFRWVSDPDGTRLGRPLDAWNAAERGGIFHPLVLLVAPDGRELVRHRSRDFADRGDDGDVLAALATLGLPPRELPESWAPEPWAPPGVQPRPSDGAFRPEAFGPYFRGLRFGTRALAARMRDEQDAAEVAATSQMAESFLDAWHSRRASSR